MSLIGSAVLSTIRSRGVPFAVALALAACGGGAEPAVTPTDSAGDQGAQGAAGGTMLASSAALLGRWQKIERSLPPITLELRSDAADRVTGRVWLSGVTYDAPATLGDSSFTLGAGRPTMRGALTANGRLRVQMLDAQGAVQHEATLARMQ